LLEYFIHINVEPGGGQGKRESKEKERETRQRYKEMIEEENKKDETKPDN